MTATPDVRYVRRSARVALLDPAGAVLLIRSRFRRRIEGIGSAWFLPGGGIEPGESLRAAAVREVREETGIELAEAALIELAWAAGDGTVGDLSGPMRDDVFAIDAPSVEISPAGLEPHERLAHDSYRWWRIPDLRRTADAVFPLGLAQVLGEYATAPSWPSPPRLPW